MKRTSTNLLVDAIAFVFFVLLTATGLVERFLLPPGTGRFQSVWGWDRHQWGQLHYWIALLLMATLAAHVVLHWKWIVCTLRGRQRDDAGWRVALGIVGLLGLLGLAIAPFLATVVTTGSPGKRQMESAEGHNGAWHDASSTASTITGAMSLQEVEQATGVGVDVLIRELNLPTTVRRDITLGRLRRQYDFEMESVRRVVAEHTASQ